ncbi:DNA topoisomerase 1-like [Argiope bruennichi]|uniref:DNA topoisomerase 1-like n=1 Tax=Argiope bruennichi TaxID=94029 RepID=UPI002495040F|nr:DNA topoisomerase 1-like [Argiope bruennichi]
MNDMERDYYSSGQGTTTPVVSPPLPKDSFARSHGETLKMMNPTPNGYSSHAPKVEGQDIVKKHHDSSKNSEHKHKHSSDHVKKKDGEEVKKKDKDKSHHKSKDSSSSKDPSKKESSKEHKEKKHKEHKESSKSKEGGENRHSESSKHNSSEEKSKHLDIKKETNSVHEKPKSDNFKENEKIKDKESKHKESKDKHKDKHKDKESKPHKDKSKEKTKDGEKHKEKHKDKHKDKDKQKHKEHKEKKEKIKIEVDSDSMKSPPPPAPEPPKIKDEPFSDEDAPLAQQIPVKIKSIKREHESEEEEEAPKPKEKKIKEEKKKAQKKRKTYSDEEEDDDYETKKPVKKVKKEKAQQKIKQEAETASPRKKAKKEEEQEVWKWWEEEKLEDGIKWRTLEHNGPVFAPPYERVPDNVKFYYDGKVMKLSEGAEEVAGFYGRMLDHEYTSKDVFNHNFFKDWRKVMTPQEREIITDLKKCNFKDFDLYYKQKSEERKAMTKEEKLKIKKENEALTEKYGFCIIDGHKQKIGNFKIEPPGLFRGRGEHPKMGMLKRRIEAEDILINIGKEAKVPEPPPGHKWKEVRHDNTVSWLASWSENILGSTKYIMLNPSSKLKGEKDWQKYETARKLKAHVVRIRNEYTQDFKSKEMRMRQRAVALYFIDKLALRAGNEKDEDTADTVGCCSLRVEHITLDEEKDGQEYVVSFDFLGKDSIRYVNSVPVEKRVFKNLKLFMENKQPGDDLFDRLNTSILNKYLNDLMEGLTAKVFRTYNASNTLQEQLDLLTKEDMSIPEKILAYNRANRAVAILCNHQRAVPKGFSKSMENLKAKIDDKNAQIKEMKKEVKAAKNSGSKQDYEKKRKRLNQLEDQLKKLELQATDKEENKQIALGTSKLNYLDPRISVAWCKKWGVPIEKIYNKTQRDKFRWAIEMAGPDYKF